MSDSISGAGTVVGLNVALSGTLREKDNIEIHGMVDGELISEKDVIIGETAQIKGPVKASVVTVGGVVNGSIDAEEKLEILESGKVYGSIATKNLVIHSGALFIGDSTMPNPDKEEAVSTTKREKIEKPEEDNQDNVLEPDKE